jgi:hypothetical protein
MKVFFEQDVSLYIQTFQVLYPKTILPFFQKGEETAELVFFLNILFEISNNYFGFIFDYELFRR